jgi:AcrR family transcriptional regulator
LKREVKALSIRREERMARPRSEAVDRAILDAAVEVLVRDGYGALSIEAVAAEAGVGRPTIYRRYPSRVELLEAAVSRAFESANPEVPDTGDAREDLRILLANTLRMLRDTPMGQVIRELVPALPRDEALRRMAREVDRGRRKLMRAAIERGVSRAELAASLDVELVTDALLGAVYLRFLVTGRPLPNRLPGDLVRELLG